MKHTPEPWTIEYDNSDNGWCYRVGPAELWASYNCCPETGERVKSGARLISMAPVMRDLLATLERDMILSTPRDMRHLDQIREILAYIEEGKI